MKTNRLKDRLIKLLGGYTEKEYLRVERKYEALLDSKTGTIVSASVCNAHLYKLLKSLNDYAKGLYGSFLWKEKMYNVIHNNMLRIYFRYINENSSTIYSLDTTLDEKDQFKRILDDEGQRKAQESCGE